MRGFTTDLRLAWRTLSRSPGFACVAIGLLALAIGTNTAVFTVTRAALFTRLGVAEPSSLLLLGNARSWGVMMGQTGEQQALSAPLLRHLRAADGDFASLAGVGSFLVEAAARSGAGDAAPAHVALVSGNYFTTLGVAAAAGRVLSDADDVAAAAPAVVVSHAYWQRALGASPAAVGSTLALNGHPFTILGVAPEGFFGETVARTLPDVWAPLARQPEVTGRPSILEARRPSWLYAIGRLRDGVDRAAAQSRLDGLLRAWLTDMQGEISAEERAAIGRATFRLTPAGHGVSHRREAFTRAFRLLFGASATVLLLACGNVAILLLARAARREREVDVRRALGASRGAIARHVLAEGVVLAAAGAALGVVSAVPLTGVLARWAAAVVVPGTAAALTWPVLTFAALAALGAAVLVSLAPALRLVARAAAPAGSLAGSAARTTQAAPRAFIVLELAVALPLLVVTALMAGSLTRLLATDAGFAREGVVVARMTLKPAHPRPAELPALYGALRARLDAMPGVETSGLALYGPLAEGSWVGPIEPEGTKPAAAGVGVWWNRVTPGYLEALGARVVAGRLLGASDAGTTAVVVNRELVRKFFPEGSPIGRRFSPAGDPATRFEIVGVVGDLQFDSLRNGAPPMYFAPFAGAAADAPGDESQFAGEIALRVDATAVVGAAEVRRALREVNPDILLRDVTPIGARIAASTARERLTTTLCEIAGLLALLLAIFGIGAVVAQATVQRTREFGLRLALGAAPRDLLAMVLGGTARTAALGVALGAALSLGVVRLVRSELYGVGALEISALLAAAAVLLLASLLAGAVPAARAARLDPVAALRQE